jgi:hypothetical protein
LTGGWVGGWAGLGFAGGPFAGCRILHSYGRRVNVHGGYVPPDHRPEHAEPQGGRSLLPPARRAHQAHSAVLQLRLGRILPRRPGLPDLRVLPFDGAGLGGVCDAGSSAAAHWLDRDALLFDDGRRRPLRHAQEERIPILTSQVRPPGGTVTRGKCAKRRETVIWDVAKSLCVCLFLFMELR